MAGNLTLLKEQVRNLTPFRAFYLTMVFVCGLSSCILIANVAMGVPFSVVVVIAAPLDVLAILVTVLFSTRVP